MYPIADDVKKIFLSGAKQYARITMTRGETVQVITEECIVQGGLSVNRYSATGSDIELGSAVASELTLELSNYDGRFNNVEFEGAELFVEAGVAMGAEQRVSFVPLGYFTVEGSPRHLKTIHITALDRMMRFDKRVNRYSLQFPTTIDALLDKICEICGVEHVASAALPERAYKVDRPPYDKRATYRQYLQWIAQIKGACAYIDWDGKLRLDWYTLTSERITSAERFGYDIYEKAVVIDGVTITSDNTDHVYSDGGRTLTIADNAFIQGDPSTVGETLKSRLQGFSYTPFSAETLPMPHIYPLDIVQLILDGDGEPVKGAVTDVTFRLNGNTQILGKGDTDTENANKSGFALSGSLYSSLVGAVLDNPHLQGPTGATGATGAIGPTGLMGPTGRVGPTGPAIIPKIDPSGVLSWTISENLIDPPHDSHIIGPTGRQGDKGDKGDTGLMGPTGKTGAVGPTGLQGLQGAAGKNGINYGVGKCLYTDTNFANTTNSVHAYAYSGSDNVECARVASPSDSPNTGKSGYDIRVTTKGATSPGLGGVYQNIYSRPSAIFVRRLIAKIPVGYTLTNAQNNMGDGWTVEWLTPQVGTGKYTEYVYKYTCGTTGNFSSGGHMYLQGAAASESNPVVWYIAHCTTYDMTEVLEGRQGPTGPVLVPTISASGIISWSAQASVPTVPSFSILGPTGRQGDKGDKGDTGLMGPTGKTGAIGPTGLQGLQGIQGVAGKDGKDGAKGDKGEKGDTGPVLVPTISASGIISWSAQASVPTVPSFSILGPTGRQGDKGDKGDKGEKGDTGLMGPTGKTGPQGPQGLQGLQGIQGVAGVRGTLHINIQTMPELNRDTIDGKPVTHRILKTVVMQEGGVDEVNPGDILVWGSYYFPVVYVDKYAYCGRPTDMQGPTGRTGATGPVFVPTVSTKGVLSWSMQDSASASVPPSVSLREEMIDLSSVSFHLSPTTTTPIADVDIKYSRRMDVNLFIEVNIPMRSLSGTTRDVYMRSSSRFFSTETIGYVVGQAVILTPSGTYLAPITAHYYSAAVTKLTFHFPSSLNGNSTAYCQMNIPVQVAAEV